MKYLRWYYNILNKAFLEKRSKDDGYFEAHHIKPFSLGGKRTVLLTAREHYIAHFILYKHYKKHGNENQKIKSARAWKCMTFQSNDNIARYNSHTFEYARIAFNKSMTGENHPFFGKKHSKESLEKMSKSLLANDKWRKAASENMKKVRQTVSAEQEKQRVLRVKEAITGKPNCMRGKKHTKEACENMRKGALGKPKSDSHKENISKGWEKRKIHVCPHCGKSSKNASPMFRFHFNNCKYLQKTVI